jgi:hypothetical protein
MGRYFTGDIEGKFWFGVQSSDDAEFFGVEGRDLYGSDEDEEAEENAYGAEYSFTGSELEDLERGLEICHEELGEWKIGLDEFFTDRDLYNEDEIAEHMQSTKEQVREKLEWYARLILGEKIHQCVLDNGSCTFEAEY